MRAQEEEVACVFLYKGKILGAPGRGLNLATNAECSTPNPKPQTLKPNPQTLGCPNPRIPRPPRPEGDGDHQMREGAGRQHPRRVVIKQRQAQAPQRLAGWVEGGREGVRESRHSQPRFMRSEVCSRNASLTTAAAASAAKPGWGRCGRGRQHSQSECRGSERDCPQAPRKRNFRSQGVRKHAGGKGSRVMVHQSRAAYNACAAVAQPVLGGNSKGWLPAEPQTPTPEP